MTKCYRLCYLKGSDWANASSWRLLGIGSDSLRFTVTLVKHHYQPAVQPSHNGPTGMLSSSSLYRKHKEPCTCLCEIAADALVCLVSPACHHSLLAFPAFVCYQRLKCHEQEGVRRKERLHLNRCHGNSFSLCVALRDRGSAETEIIDPQCNSNRSDEATTLQIVPLPTGEKQQHIISLKSPAFLNLCKEKGGSGGRQIWVSAIWMLGQCWWIRSCSGAARLFFSLVFSLTVVTTNMKALTTRKQRRLAPCRISSHPSDGQNSTDRRACWTKALKHQTAAAPFFLSMEEKRER